MRVVVTGGAGFIGSAVCRYLVGEVGATVLNVDRLGTTSSQASLAAVSCSPRYTFRRADIGNGAHIAGLLDAFEPAAIMHLAAETNGDLSVDTPDAFIASNVVGTYRLLEAVRGYWGALPASAKAQFRFVHVSTDEVYGTLGSVGRFGETSAYAPSSPYAASKAASDHLALAWHRSCGLPALISHAASTYGPYQLPATLVPATIVDAIEGRPLTVLGDGASERHWLHVDDCVRALCVLLTRGRVGEIYNIGPRRGRTDLDVVERIADLLDELRPAPSPRRALVKFVEDRAGHDRRRAVDTAKIESETGWKAEIGFDVGLRRTVRWYLENEGWWRPLREGGHGGWSGVRPQARVA